MSQQAIRTDTTATTDQIRAIIGRDPPSSGALSVEGGIWHLENGAKDEWRFFQFTDN